MNRGILVVSFGTSYMYTREKTIDQIERDIENEFPSYKIYNAFTSKMILKVLKERDHIHVNTVVEALEEMLNDGMEHIIIQPTLILNGIEYDLMMEDINQYKEKFKSVLVGTPLLTTTEDSFNVIDGFLQESPDINENEAIVFMGHGSDHYVNSIYAALDYMFKARGHENIYMATVEAYPELYDIMDGLKCKNYKKIYLLPFMIVAGDHATNDMASEEEDSWKCILENEGFQVECILKGLGENKNIRKIFIDHIYKVME